MNIPRPPEETAIVPHQHQKTVLVVDDTVKILNIIKFFLEEEGYICKTTTSPEQGIEMAKATRVTSLRIAPM